MPNVGKPSKGCKNCRDRKVKCDQKRPSCSQCIRVGKECFGYRDPLSMMFKNESEVVVSKAQKRYEELSKQKEQKLVSRHKAKAWETSSQSSGTSEYSPVSTPRQLVSRPGSPSSPNSITHQMIPSIEDQAMSFFFANYVVEPSVIPRGNFEYLNQLLNRPDTERVLQSSVSAAGLAGLANATKSDFILKRAQEEYVSALRMTNKALRDPKEAVKDSTLISVIMLGMYENFIYYDADSLQRWAKHVDGASALIALRGEEQVNTDLGMRMIKQFYGTVLLVALEAGTAIPEGATRVWEASTRSSDSLVHGKEWTHRLVRFMRNSINLTLDTTSDPRDLVARAVVLDRELDAIKARMPNVWKYETIYLEEPAPHVYGNFYHVYIDPWIAQMQNNLRICKIHLHKVTRTELKKGSQQYPPLFPLEQAQQQIRASEQLMRSSIAGICASAPQYTGQIRFPDLTGKNISPATFVSELFDPQDPDYQLHPQGTFLNPFRPTGLHHLLFPVYTAGHSDLSPPALRLWAIDQLLFIALKIGTRQAVVLADDLKARARSGSVSEVSDEDDGLLFTM